MRRVTSSPVDLALGNDGRIFIVGRSGLGQGIRIINQEDDNLGVFGGGDLQWPAAMVIDREQKLYVSDEATDKICIFSTEGEGKFLESWGEHGDGDGQLDRPSGLAFDADENLYIVDSGNNRIQKFTKDGKFLMQFGSVGTGDGDGHAGCVHQGCLERVGQVGETQQGFDPVEAVRLPRQHAQEQIQLGRCRSGDGVTHRVAVRLGGAP